MHVLLLVLTVLIVATMYSTHRPCLVAIVDCTSEPTVYTHMPCLVLLTMPMYKKLKKRRSTSYVVVTVNLGSDTASFKDLVKVALENSTNQTTNQTA